MKDEWRYEHLRPGECALLLCIKGYPTGKNSGRQYPEDGDEALAYIQTGVIPDTWIKKGYTRRQRENKQFSLF